MSGYGVVPSENLQIMRDHAHTEFRYWQSNEELNKRSLETSQRMAKKWLDSLLAIESEQAKRKREANK